MSANSSLRSNRIKTGGNISNQPNLVEEDSETMLPEHRAPFVRVMYGNGKELIVNLACLNKHVTRVIRKKCRLERSGNYDLISTRGELCQYWTKSPTEYAQDFLSEREVYVLVKMENPDTNQQKLLNSQVKWKPMVDSLDDYPELKEIYESEDITSLTDMENSSKRRTEADASKPKDRRSSKVNTSDVRKMSIKRRVNGKY